MAAETPPADFYLIQNLFKPRQDWFKFEGWHAQQTLEAVAFEILATEAPAYKVLLIRADGTWSDETAPAMEAAWNSILDLWDDGDREHPAFRDRYQSLHDDLALSREHVRQERWQGQFR